MLNIAAGLGTLMLCKSVCHTRCKMVLVHSRCLQSMLYNKRTTMQGVCGIHTHCILFAWNIHMKHDHIYDSMTSPRTFRHIDAFMIYSQISRVLTHNSPHQSWDRLALETQILCTGLVSPLFSWNMLSPVSYLWPSVCTMHLVDIPKTRQRRLHVNQLICQFQCCPKESLVVDIPLFRTSTYIHMRYLWFTSSLAAR